MDKPYLLTRKEFDAVDTYGDHLPVCRAQHLKTLTWLEQKMGRAVKMMMQDYMGWDSILAQARKDVKE